MRYYFICILFILYSNSFAQDIYEQYPAGQTDYIGGNVQFYKDFHQVLKDKKLQPCENKKEAFSFRIVVSRQKNKVC